MGKFAALFVVFLLVVPSSARTLTVDDDGPADYRSIQEAINHSWHGDMIVVRPGTYRQRVTFNGRQVTLRSENPDEPAIVNTTILHSASGASVLFDFGERDTSVLTGFTITGGGIACLGASPVISKNVIRDGTGVGIKGQNNAAPTVKDNQILSNKLEGIYSCDGLIEGNTISGNSAGLAFCNGRIVGNLISNNGDGGGLYSCDGEITGNRIIGNYTAADGGGLYGCRGQIANNIIAGNRAAKQGGGLYDCPNGIVNNTIVGNRAGELGGGLSRCPGAVCNNIIAFNEAPVTGGLQGPSGNTYNAFWLNLGENFGGGATPGIGDILADPLFITPGFWDGKGTTDKWDDVWADGDYHVQSQAGHWDPQNRQWVADALTSRCLDAGKPSSIWTGELWPHGKRIDLGAFGGTPETSLSLSDLGRRADLDHNDQVGPQDLRQLMSHWLAAQDLLAADLDRNGFVDLRDFALLALDWQVGPSAPTPPIPDPMTWAVLPQATGPYSIAMVATTATSTDGTGVEYYFEDVFNPEINSGWLVVAPGAEPRWQDVKLQPGTLYWYHVKARNRGNQLETAWSERASDTTLREDSAPPLPNPMTWQTLPYRTAVGSIRMVATTATDESGVEYQFESPSHPAYNSGWQDSPVYEVAGVPQGFYRFRVRARDKSAVHNTTQWSVDVTVDLQPPTPDPMQWAGEPKEVNIGGGSFDYHATMTAVEAKDSGAGEVEYFFECTTASGFNSGWQKSREYTVKIGRKGQRQRFRVKARDASPSHNETAWSPELPAL